MYFDYADSRFHALYCYNEKHQPVKIGFNINEIVVDRSGNVFATNGTYGFLKFGKTDTIGKEILYDVKKQQFNTIAAQMDKQGTIWILVNGVGLGRYDAAAEKIKIVSPQLAYAGCMTIDGKGKIIAGAGNELLMYDPVTLKTTRLENGLNKVTITIFLASPQQETAIYGLQQMGEVSKFGIRRPIRSPISMQAKHLIAYAAMLLMLFMRMMNPGSG